MIQATSQYSHYVNDLLGPAWAVAQSRYVYKYSWVRRACKYSWFTLCDYDGAVHDAAPMDNGHVTPSLGLRSKTEPRSAGTVGNYVPGSNRWNHNIDNSDH